MSSNAPAGHGRWIPCSWAYLPENFSIISDMTENYSDQKVNVYCRKSVKEMVLFKHPVSKVREPIKDLLKVPMKVEHHLLE